MEDRKIHKNLSNEKSICVFSGDQDDICRINSYISLKKERRPEGILFIKKIII